MHLLVIELMVDVVIMMAMTMAMIKWMLYLFNIIIIIYNSKNECKDKYLVIEYQMSQSFFV